MAKYFKKQVMNKLSIVLDKKVVFMKRKKGTNAYVQKLSDDSFEIYKDAYASVEYISSKEVYLANANNMINVVKFITWYRKDIMPDMRIHYDGGIYKIKGQRPLDKNKTYLLITGELIKHEQQR